ncbi:hypothetical protein ACJIZ3_005538 [Penstemon smallii]|uniref:Protein DETOXIFICATION n=1 Tax=Penstemon smallii TaxID=265156 RepID=A0ABD3S574_9LAMI
MEGEIKEKLLLIKVQNGNHEGDINKEENLKNKLWNENKKMWIIAGPAIFTRFSTFGISVISQAFVGHIGATELAAFALVITLLTRFANGLLLGVASGLETLCGQAYGANQHHMLGIYLQRSWIVLIITSTLLLPVYIFASPILKSLGQDEIISKEAGTIALWFVPVIYSFVVSFSCQMFLQAQSKNMIITYLAAFSLAIHVLFSWLLTVKYEFGVTGAMVSTILAYWIPNVGQLIFVISGGCSETWKGFTTLAFKDLWPVVKLSLSSGAMLCLNISGWEMMISLGFLAAASVRVSNELGRGDSKAAKFSILNIVLMSLGIGLVLFIFFLFFRERLAYIFTKSDDVAAEVARLSPLLAFSILLNSIQPVLSGVAIGAGWQSVVVYVNIGSYYLIGIPIGVILGYVIKLQVQGVWIGMLIGTLIQTIILIIITYRTDWDKQFRAMDNGIKETLLGSNTDEQKSDLKGNICEESKKIWRVALPSIISRVTSFGTIVVTQSFIGHISSTDLAGYALVQTLSVRFVNGIVIGMSSATETLCGQAFGAKQYHMMGIFLQRSWLVNLVTLTILLPVFLLARPIFVLLGEEESISKSAGSISLWFIAFIYSVVFSTTIQMYLQAQQKNMVIAWLSVFQLLIHIPLSWLFVYVLNWGVPGAMGALCISSWFLVFGEFVYIFGGWCPDSWKGFTFAALKDIFPVVKLSISSGVMICLNVTAWEFMISLGFMGAAVVRVANELGRGDAKATKFSIKVVISTSFLIGIIFWILCLIFGNKIGYLFSNKEEVVQSVSDLSVPLAFSVLFNSLYPVLSGVAIGSGLQTKVAVINLICFYGIGLPVGAVLGYVTHLQVKGIWIGMISGVVTVTLALGFMTWRTNWDEEVSKTLARLKRWYLKSSDEK